MWSRSRTFWAEYTEVVRGSLGKAGVGRLLQRLTCRFCVSLWLWEKLTKHSGSGLSLDLLGPLHKAQVIDTGKRLCVCV